MNNIFVSYGSNNNNSQLNCDNIRVCIPGDIIRSHPPGSTICFRVGGQSCCSSEGSENPQPLYSQVVCINTPSYTMGSLGEFDFNHTI